MTSTCLQCDGTWEHYAWNSTKYCSRECWRLSRIGRENPRKPPQEKNCPVCGTGFLVGTGHKSPNITYCSKSCGRHAAWAGGHNTAVPMDKYEVAWLAGLFDGEGCISWPRRELLHSVRLDIPQTNLELLEKVQAVTGTGKITARKRAKAQHSQAWTWSCYGQNARSVLRQILPWLIVKRAAAEVALGLTDATEPPWTQRTLTMQAAKYA